jgi:predicted nucleotidyltransferase/HEPN domain-containing protein
MRADLDHLRRVHRRELALAVRILFESFEDWLKTKQKRERKQGRILKVILYGSHARGTAVEDRGSGYMSDYDLLVVVNHEDLTDFEVWESAEDALSIEQHVRGRIRREVSLIVHSLQDVNDQLARGRYFFMDIVREGIALYEAEGFPLVDPQPLTPEVALEEAQGHFEYWFSKSTEFLQAAELIASVKSLNIAAFNLHQSAEAAYHCLNLVLTLYTPKLHDLRRLHKDAVKLDPRLIEIWGSEGKLWRRDGRFGKRCFELLRRAYVDARYSKHYVITAEELAWCVERVKALQEVVEAVCRDALAEPRTAADAG